MNISFSIPVLIVLSLPVLASAQAKPDYNDEVVATVESMAANNAGLGYNLSGRYSSEFSYGDRIFKPNRNGETMCVGAVFEVILRALAHARSDAGRSASKDLLPASRLEGSRAVNLAPYIFQYRSLKIFPEYGRRFSAGAGDAFVLFGIGQFVDFGNAKPGDFVYFNRSGGGGHATVFMGYLNSRGEVTTQPDSAAGFRYFSSQKNGTNGLGYRDAFFGSCPSATTKHRKDCNVIKSGDRRLFSVARLHHPNEWYTDYSEIRVARFFSGERIDVIYAGETAFREKARADAAWAEAEAKKAQTKGVFPWIATDTGSASQSALAAAEQIRFNPEEFGPDFSEMSEADR